MMESIVSMYNGDFGTLTDADGNKISDVIECYLVSGECTVLVRDPKGLFVTSLGGEEIQREKTTRKPPVVFQRRGGVGKES